MRIDKEAFRRGVDDAMTLRPLWKIIHPNGDPEVDAVRRDEVKRTIRCALIAIGLLGVVKAVVLTTPYWH